jgi:hypothetical protein
LAGYLKWDENELLKTYQDNKSRTAFDEITLGRDVEWSTIVAVETHQLDLPGVTLRARPRRNYVDGQAAAHVLGYLGEINQKQLKTFKEEGYAIGDEIGQYGLERKWENVLRGQSGGQQVEVDALGRRVRVLHEVSDVPGYTVHLTLDRQLQQTAYEALKGKEGTIVAIDIHNGAILALASTPAFDPNSFARGIKSDEWRALIQDRLRPLNNRATQGAVSARIDIQNSHGHRRPRRRRDQSRRVYFRSRFFYVRQSELPRLETGRSWLGQSAPCDRHILRHLFLSARVRSSVSIVSQNGLKLLVWVKNPALRWMTSVVARFPTRRGK